MAGPNTDFLFSVVVVGVLFFFGFRTFTFISVDSFSLFCAGYVRTNFVFLVLMNVQIPWDNKLPLLILLLLYIPLLG